MSADRDTPVRPPVPLVVAHEIGNGHGDARRDPPHETREERVDRAILECEQRFGEIMREMGDQAKRIDRVETDQKTTHHELRITNQEIRRLADLLALRQAEVQPMRPPLPSLHEVDLEVSERTINGTPVYRASSQELQAIRETDIKKAMHEFAIGEGERIQAAIVRDREHQALHRAAAPILFVRSRMLPALIIAGAIGALTLWWQKLYAFVTHH